ncbi:MAG: MBL fold metallo-hydrolase [Oscillospiraceae bacterium]|nr:MBL fold metallo-hydrolase [Oscillospiraceae bacterium]
MNIKTIPVGQLETNCYVVVNEETLACVVIDPGDESNAIMDYIESNRLRCEAIMLTHGHFDHVGAVNEILEQTGCALYINPRDEGYEVGKSGMKFKMPEGGKYYDDGDIIVEAGLEFKVLATPGHTPGSVCLICGGALFTGDTLFRGSCGRADLPGGSMREEMRSLKKICELEGDYEVYPGHMDSSSLERERRFNHYCREAMAKF